MEVDANVFRNCRVRSLRLGSNGRDEGFGQHDCIVERDVMECDGSEEEPGHRSVSEKPH